ncbi:MAG: Uma2 family endonuclease [Acidobacteriota bacterium]|nr:Uma2 family endonuclease [Acidobacteriota bacterium]
MNLETPSPGYPNPGYPPRKRWTRDECRTLESTGLWERERLELIDGDLISRKGKKRPHVNSLIFVMRELVALFGSLYVTPEAPIDVSPEDNPTNEPEPDLAVLTQPCSAFGSQNPGPSDVRLLVEISDTTLAFDMGTKARLYARAQISEYWVVDVVGQRIVVHRRPRAGVYEEITSYRAGERIEPLSASGSSFTVEQAFPTPTP